MYTLMDHEDVIKSRKALMATSVLLIILHSFQISGKTINLFGLEANFDKNLSIGLCGLAVVYFLYVFVVRVLESKTLEVLEFRLQSYKELLDELQKGIDDPEYYNKFDEKMMASDKDHIKRQHWIQSLSYKIERVFKLLKMITFLLVDVAPPILLAIFAIKKTHAIIAVSELVAFN